MCARSHAGSSVSSCLSIHSYSQYPFKFLPPPIHYSQEKKIIHSLFSLSLKDTKPCMPQNPTSVKKRNCVNSMEETSSQVRVFLRFNLSKFHPAVILMPSWCTAQSLADIKDSWPPFIPYKSRSHSYASTIF